jgi:hypothetical protein
MNFSPYTLAGQPFLGAGVELKPGNWRFSAMYGKLENPLAQLDSLISGTTLLPTFSRKAMSAKIGFGTEKNFIDLIAFRAKDDVNSVPLESIDLRRVTPEENIVAGLSFKVTLFEDFLELKGNIAGSAYTRNQNSAGDFIDAESSDILKSLENNFTVNLSSKLLFAGDAGIRLKLPNFTFGLEFKRVDPLYRSLGAYYFQDDYQLYTFLLNTKLLNGKIRLNGRFGIQENNIGNLRNFTNKRTIASASLTIAPTTSFVTSAQFSNFNYDQKPGIREVNDTLKLTRTNSVMSISPRYTIRGTGKSSTISAAASYSSFKDLNRFSEGGSDVNQLNANLNYRLQFTKNRWGVGVSALYNENDAANLNRQRIGGSLSANKDFFDRLLNVRLSTSYNKSFVERDDDGDIITARLSVSVKPKKNHVLTLQTNYLNRNTIIQQAYSEWRGSILYTFRFSK